MSIAKCTMGIEFLHTDTQLENAYKHNYRHEGYYGENVDPSRSHLNEQLIGEAEKSYKESFYQKIEETPYYKTHSIHKHAIKAYSFWMEIGDGDVPEEFNYNKWKERCITFLKDEFGEKNVISAVLHLDEGKPHIHAIVVPMKDKLSSRQYLPKSYSLAELHQRYYKGYMKELGLASPNKGTRAKHTDIERLLYAPLDKVAQENLSRPLENETLDEYYERANNEFRDHNFGDFKKDQKLKMTLKEAEQLRRANHRSEQEIRKKLEIEVLKEAKAKSLEEVIERAKAQTELKRGLRFIAASDPERAAEINNGIKEAISKAREIDLYKAMDEALMNGTKDNEYNLDEVKQCTGIEYEDVEINV